MLRGGFYGSGGGESGAALALFGEADCAVSRIRRFPETALVPRARGVTVVGGLFKKRHDILAASPVTFRPPAPPPHARSESLRQSL
jgi:hypothetical protein